MPAYMLVRARISDREKFSAYASAMPAAVAEAGGEYLVLGGNPTWIEGEADSSSFVISRWPDLETAQRFWDSPAYARIKPLRAGCGEFEVVFLDGLDPNP